MIKQKKIMLIGSNILYGSCFPVLINGKINNISNCSRLLEEKYSIDNYSMRNLSCVKALDYLKKALRSINDYDYAIIELGMNEYIEKLINKEKEFNDFKDNIILMVKILKEFNITPCVVTLNPIDPNALISKYNLNFSISDITVMHKRLNKVLKSLEEEGAIILDINKAISKTKDLYMSDDLININKEGHSLLKNMIFRKL